MRLLNTTTHRVEEFHGNEVPPYTFLSHTWEGDEASSLLQTELNEVRNVLSPSLITLFLMIVNCRLVIADWMGGWL
jgi:hypothetical protein